jgi:threonine/homoserine/homoserine lactone efflux protein
MDSLLFFAKGAAVGFAIAAPVGPIGVLCVRRTLAFGPLTGLVSGFGAAVADALFGVIAAFGLTMISSWMSRNESAFRLVGGAFLIYLAWRILSHAAPANSTAPAEPSARLDLASAFGSTFVLTLTNPITIVAFLGVFATVGVGELASDRLLAGALVVGVFAGSALWWLVLAGGAGLLRDQLDGGGLVWVNRASGAVMLGFATYALGGLWF